MQKFWKMILDLKISNHENYYFLFIFISFLGYSTTKENLNQRIYWITDGQVAYGL